MMRDEIDELVALRLLGRPARVALDHEARYAELVTKALDLAAVVQRTSTPPSGKTRSAMRSRRAMRVRIAWGREEQQALTVDVGSGGFQALLGVAPPRGATVSAWIDLGRQGTVEALVHVVDVREKRGSSRASFRFVEMEGKGAEALREILLDAALSELSLATTRAPTLHRGV